MDILKAYEIKDAKIQFVSLVDKPANFKKFIITKAEKGVATFSTYGKILKADNKSHFITGIVYEPNTEDAHGNFMTVEEIEKASRYFMKNGGAVDQQHSFEPLKGATVVENWTAKTDFKIEGEPIKKGTWLLTMEIENPEIWQQIENGEITGFSMGGIGKYSEEETKLNNSDNLGKTEEQSDKKGILKKLGEMLGIGTVEKAGKKMSEANKETLQTAYNALGVLLEAVEAMPTSETSNNGAENTENTENTEAKETKEEKTKESKGGEEMTREEIEKLIKETVAGALKEQKEKEAQEQAETEEGKETKGETVTAEAVAEMVKKAVNETVEPILKARGVPTAINGNTSETQTIKKHYLTGIL